jgi:hypothetical protein
LWMIHQHIGWPADEQQKATGLSALCRAMHLHAGSDLTAGLLLCLLKLQLWKVLQQLCYRWRECQPVNFGLEPCFAMAFGNLHLAHCAASRLLLSQTWKPAAAVQLSACL